MEGQFYRLQLKLIDKTIERDSSGSPRQTICIHEIFIEAYLPDSASFVSHDQRMVKQNFEIDGNPTSIAIRFRPDNLENKERIFNCLRRHNDKLKNADEFIIRLHVAKSYGDWDWAETYTVDDVMPKRSKYTVIEPEYTGTKKNGLLGPVFTKGYPIIGTVSLMEKNSKNIKPQRKVELKVDDLTDIQWEKSPTTLIQTLAESIPNELIPANGFPSFYLTKNLLHAFTVRYVNDNISPDEHQQRHFTQWVNNNEWAFVTYNKPCDIYLAIGSRLDAGNIYFSPIEYTIFFMIGYSWLYGRNEHGDNNASEKVEEYACFCFLNYILNNHITTGYYEEFPAGFIQGKIDKAEIFLQTSSYFKWPDTIALPSSAPDAVITERDWPQEGMLKHKGYSVGSSSNVTRWKRQIILRDVYENPLPNVMDSDYMAQWGRPQSAKRLKKMAESLAAFTKNAKRKRSQGNFDVAIADWEEDLAWLKEEFYDGVYNRIFPWPNLKV